MNEREVFVEALQRTRGAAREAYVREACQGDDALLARVRELLMFHDGAASLPDASPEALLRDFAKGDHPPLQSSLVAGTVIAGRYTLLEKIAEGGMGEVWVAKQAEPVKRRVALKLIRAGMDSKGVQARFEQERQALAVMDHPNIARVFDGGLTEAGQPFFAMELVNGLPLTKFCDEAKLTPRERLELFVPICLAVQHAHQKGIVHRDLKPANILVTLVDGRPVPKVIDFGVAKATGEKLTEESLATQFGAIVGTLEYMAPEQTGYSGADVDTRADIYALGVVLYELLTGLRPIDSRQLKQGAFLEMIRIIREEEPSKPSTRLSTDASLPSLAALRQTDPKKLTALLRGELDWVVMRCLEKERDRRYETANGLARDIQRFLANEPVEAKPPTKAYRMRKFLQRNKGAMIAASLVVLALLGGIVGTTLGMIQADRAAGAERAAKIHAQEQEEIARRAAEAETAAKLQAHKDRDVAEASRKEERLQRRQAEAIAAFVCYDLLAMTYSDGREHFAEKDEQRLTKDSTLGQLLDRAAVKLKEAKGLDPRIESELSRIVGASYRSNSDPAKGIPFLERAVQLRERVVPHDDKELLNTRNSLAVAYAAAGRTRQAEKIFAELYEISRKNNGPQHPLTLKYREAVARSYRDSGEVERAIPIYEEILKTRRASKPPDIAGTISTMAALAGAYHLNSKLEQAVPLFEEALRLSKARSGPEPESSLILRTDLATAYRKHGKLDAALSLYEETLRLLQDRFGNDHSVTLICMNNYGEALLEAGKPELAVPLLEKSIASMKVKPGLDHPNTIICMVRLAGAYRKLDRKDDAAKLQEEAFRSLKGRQRNDDEGAITGMNNLACELRDAGQYELAGPLFEETIRLLRAARGSKNILTLSCMTNLAETYQAAGQPARAIPLLEEISKLMDESSGPDHNNSFTCLHNLARAYDKAGQLERAEQTHREYATRMLKKHGEEAPNYSVVLSLIGQNLQRQKKYRDAEVAFRESLSLRQRTDPDDWTTFQIQSMLGGALLGQKKFDEAEPLLRASVSGMMARLKKIQPDDRMRVAEAIDRMVVWAKSADKPDELAKWLAERQAFPLEKAPLPRRTP